MASTMPRPVAAKQLGALLEEQQEPFTLEVYLLERGHLKNNLNLEGSFRCCSGNSNKLLKRSVSCGLSKRRRVIPIFSKIVRAVLNKLVSMNLQMNNRESRDQNSSVTTMDRSSQEVAEEERFSSASSTTVFQSCSESDTEDTYDSAREGHGSSTTNTCQAMKVGNLLTGKELTGCYRQKVRRRFGEDGKQRSPVSMLEEIQSDEGSPIQNTQSCAKTGHNNVMMSKDVPDESIFSASSCELPVHSSMEKPSSTCVGELPELTGRNFSSQYIKNRRALQQTTQLLFDCVREVVETHGRKNTSWKHFHEFLEPEELAKLLSENIWKWSAQSVDEINKTQLPNLDFLASAEEWSDFEQQTREISVEIGDAILEDISNEIVTDMIKFVAPNLC